MKNFTKFLIVFLAISNITAVDYCYNDNDLAPYLIEINNKLASKL
jgi:hypothetical protein